VRVPRSGGLVEAYDPDSLGEPIWTTLADVPRIREVLGVNVESRLLMVVDTLRNLVAVDLESRGFRTQAAGIEAATMVADGSLYTVGPLHRVSHFEAGLPSQYRPPLPVPPIFATGTLGDHYVAIVGTKPRKLLVLAADRVLHSTEVPTGEAAATEWGDLVAIAAGTEIVVYQTEDPYDSRHVGTSGSAEHLTFSPSGHRLYVSHDNATVEIFDRYSLDRVGTIDLPGVPRALRTDGSGRWLLCRPATGDSVWVVDLATGKSAGTLASDWGPELPTVAGAATLLASRQGDLVAIDLARAGRPQRGRVTGGAADHWVVTAWLPPERERKAAAAAESILVAQDSLLVVDSSRVPGPAGDQLFLQVSSSQNPDWSKDFAQRLTADGYPARVLAPTTPDEGYRVVVGPYGTREAAEETGRKLGRPYFILTNPRIKQ